MKILPPSAETYRLTWFSWCLLTTATKMNFSRKRKRLPRGRRAYCVFHRSSEREKTALADQTPNGWLPLFIVYATMKSEVFSMPGLSTPSAAGAHSNCATYRWRSFHVLPRSCVR